MKYADLISCMTLAEKCAILNGATNWETKSIPRLNIPSLFLSDGPVGVRKQEGPSDHLGLNASVPATCFPSPATLANSWDEALVERVGTAMGKEARALGVDILLGPGLNLKRNPLCGRNFEYYSEDPYLAGKLAAAAIRGLQSNGIGACAKHFAVNSQEHLRMHSDSVLDERTLHEMYLTAFEIAVREGKPKAVMSAYNRINGVYANDSKALLQDTLRDEWGFDGIVVTDWGASNERVAGLVAGNHLEMPGSTGISDLELMDAVQAGELDEKLLDTRVDELLQVILPLAEHQKDEAAFGTEVHHAIAREAAAQSIVLLKNDGDILPLCTGEKVVVIGDLAGTPRYQGSGSSAVNAAKVDIPLDLLRQSGLDVAGYALGYRRDGTADNGLLTTAVELAKQAHTVILYMGLTESYESEGMDRPHMRLPENQEQLLHALSAVNNRIVVALSGGAPFEMRYTDKCRAILHGYLGGQAGAGAMADVLVGTCTPSGRLAESWPASYGEVPNAAYYPGREATAEYREGIFVGYRYYQKAEVAVRWPFGHGLSYTTFDYADMRCDETGVTVTVINTGKRPGYEVVQVYIAKPESAIFRPAQELKGFAKVLLMPGESKTVHIPLDDKAFRYLSSKVFGTKTAIITFFRSSGIAS